ncbi:MAG: imidazole glycerol phosphate synthase subunit HisF, partial [Planctomycetaceae bacterium]|nr:imidazole glycerol phosphate synthase subunit HisF [Planctomycetaceae bacterium]
INSLAVVRPDIIEVGAKALGRQCIVLGMDPIQNDDIAKFPSGYEVTTHGCRQRTGMDAVVWAKRAVELGVGEIVVNSVDRDGTRDGFELTITGMIADAVDVPVVASGGAGNAQHLAEVFVQSHADAAIVAGILHTGLYTIQQIKDELNHSGIAIRKSV